MRAYCLIRDRPEYRRSAFMAGLRAAGCAVVAGAPVAVERGALLVIWNRYWDMDALAARVEAAGGRVLVAENGYLGEGGCAPKFEPSYHAGSYFALAEGYHNGAGRFPNGDGAERFARLGIELQPLQRREGYVLVCPNRSFGVPRMMMPPDWGARTAERLRRQGFKVRLREHPGNHKPTVPLADDLAGAACVYVWHSSAGLQAMVAGVPVVSDAPHWVGYGGAFASVEAALGGWDQAEREALRLRALERVACAQRSLAEIESGEAFRRLLS